MQRRKGNDDAFVFEVLKDGAVIDTRSVVLPHIRYAWAEIAQLAKTSAGKATKSGSRMKMGELLSSQASAQCGIPQALAMADPV